MIITFIVGIGGLGKRAQTKGQKQQLHGFVSCSLCVNIFYSKTFFELLKATIHAYMEHGPVRWRCAMSEQNRPRRFNHVSTVYLEWG